MSNSKAHTSQIAASVTAAEVVLDALVRCTEIDVNGHVNNAKYVEYLEWGREEWYERHGFAYDRLKNLGVITVVVNITVNLRQP
jgi:YbgC/YbaW family acyl-CoA thioester hydrolase